MKKFTSFLVMLFMSTLVFAQTAITSPDQIASGKIYWFDNAWLNSFGYPSTLFWPGGASNEAYKLQLWSSYMFDVANDMTDPTQQYAFIKSGENFYLYNVGAKSFISYKNNGAWLTDVPTSYVTVSQNAYSDANFPWNIAFDGANLIGDYPVDGYEYSGYLYCSGRVEDNDHTLDIFAWQIYEVGELENVAELEAQLAEALVTGAAEKEAALGALEELSYEIEDYIEVTVAYSAEGGEKIALQATDPSTPGFIYCNEPEATEGPITDLVDGSTSNFFHSNWHGSAATVHFLEVDLGAGNELDAFSFGYVTRPSVANDFPDAITIQGSNDGETFTDIAVISEDLPQVQSTTWQSENIACGEKYRYIRFNIAAERIYFHMAEFWMNYPLSESTNEAYLPYTKYIRELIALYEQAEQILSDHQYVKAADINALIEEIKALQAMIESLVNGKEDPLTVEYIAEIENKYTQNGVGFPTVEAGAAFQALVDAAKANPTTQARLDLMEALEDYLKIDDIIMPENGKKYTLAFVTWSGRVNYLDYDAAINAIVLKNDTLTKNGLAYPETAVFTCADNNDGTFSFTTADGKYLSLPAWNGATNGTENNCVSEAPVTFIIEKIHPNGKAPDATYEMLFGLVAFNFNGTYYAPNSSGETYYTGNLPHFQSSWTSAMTVKEYTGETGIDEVIVNDAVEGIYDLSGRRLESISGAGVYIVNGKKVLVK